MFAFAREGYLVRPPVPVRRSIYSNKYPEGTIHTEWNGYGEMATQSTFTDLVFGLGAARRGEAPVALGEHLERERRRPRRRHGPSASGLTQMEVADSLSGERIPFARNVLDVADERGARST